MRLQRTGKEREKAGLSSFPFFFSPLQDLTWTIEDGFRISERIDFFVFLFRPLAALPVRPLRSRLVLSHLESKLANVPVTLCA